MVEHEEPYGRRQVAMRAFGINLRDKFRQVRFAAGCDLSEGFPKGILKADAGPVAGDYDRTLGNKRFHNLSPYRMTAIPSAKGSSRWSTDTPLLCHPSGERCGGWSAKQIVSRAVKDNGSQRRAMSLFAFGTPGSDT